MREKTNGPGGDTADITSDVDFTHPLLDELKIQLLQLKPEEQLKLPQRHFEGISKQPIELAIVEIAAEAAATLSTASGFHRIPLLQATSSHGVMTSRSSIGVSRKGAFSNCH